MQSNESKAALVGEWRGTKQLYFGPPPTPPISSASELTVKAVAGGGFLQFAYNWTYEGEQQTGVLLIGNDDENAASAAWVDSFHMSGKIMSSLGTASETSLDVRGSYAAPPGPDWGWSIAIRCISPNKLQVVMHNISPEGQEDLAVQIDYTRVS